MIEANIQNLLCDNSISDYINSIPAAKASRIGMPTANWVAELECCVGTVELEVPEVGAEAEVEVGADVEVDLAGEEVIAGVVSAEAVARVVGPLDAEAEAGEEAGKEEESPKTSAPYVSFQGGILIPGQAATHS